MFDKNETLNLNPEDEATLSAEIERLGQLAVKYGLDVSNDETARALCEELAVQIDRSNRKESTADVVQATVEKVAGKRQAQTHLDAIRAVYKREPTIGENLRAGYARAKPVEEPAQPPPEGSSPIKLFEYYYKNLAPK